MLANTSPIMNCVGLEMSLFIQIVAIGKSMIFALCSAFTTDCGFELVSGAMPKTPSVPITV